VRTPRRTSAGLVLAVALLGPLSLTAAPAQAATPVGYQALLTQLESGPLIRAVINPPLRHIEIKFRDLSEWEAVYPPGAEPSLLALSHRRHIHVIFASRHHHPGKAGRPAAVHHHLRYIAAAVLGAIVVIGAVALALARRSRRRRPASAPSPQAPGN
jgi:hypothetical protein